MSPAQSVSITPLFAGLLVPLDSNLPAAAARDAADA